MDKISDLEILCRGVDLHELVGSRYLVWDAIEGRFTYDEAVKLAADKGMTLPTPVEAMILWHGNEGFRRSVSDCYFWLESSSYSYARGYAWIFLGSYGGVSDSGRSNTVGVRCVGRPRAT